jgi:hypothetical protein
VLETIVPSIDLTVVLQILQFYLSVLDAINELLCLKMNLPLIFAVYFKGCLEEPELTQNEGQLIGIFSEETAEEALFLLWVVDDST